MDLSTLQLSAAEFQTTLEKLYDAQLPVVAKFVNLGRAIGGIGALLYISAKVWSHIARAEPVDVFPLLRPFAIAVAIMLFVPLCSAMRGLTLAVSHVTDSMQLDQQKQINQLFIDKEKALEKALAANVNTRDFATDEAMEDKLKQMNSLDISGKTVLHFKRLQFEVGKNFREWMKNVLELAAIGARLFISLLMTLFLSVLSIAGPIAFGIAIFPGFGGGIQKWFGHFITISLWLPIANIFSMFLGGIQLSLLQNDIVRLAAGGSVETSDFGYLLFLVLSIGAYLFVPKGADMLVAASGSSGAASSFMGAVTGQAAMAGAMGGASVRGGANGLGAGVGATAGLTGRSLGDMTAGERFGHRAGTAVRNQVSKWRSPQQ